MKQHKEKKIKRYIENIEEKKNTGIENEIKKKKKWTTDKTKMKNKKKYQINKSKQEGRLKGEGQEG